MEQQFISSSAAEKAGVSDAPNRTDDAVFAETDAATAAVVSYEILTETVRAQSRLQRIVFVLAVGLVIVSVISAIGYFRRPKVIVAVQTPDGQRIAAIDDLKFGATEQIRLGEDKLTDEDKKELVNRFLQAYYAVDLASRAKDIPFALSLMMPESAKAHYKLLTERGVLQRERDEGFSATWNTDNFEVERANTIQVIGTQKLRRVFGGKTETERIQYKIGFVLHTDGTRDNTPLRCGYRIVKFNAEEVTRSKE